MIRTWQVCSLPAITLAGLTTDLLAGAVAADEPKAKVTHSFLAAGNETFIGDGTGKTTWKYLQVLLTEAGVRQF